MGSITKIFKDLQENLSSKCCGKFILSNIPKNPQYIKLYDRINDACEENERFKWYELSIIHKFNNSEARPSGIVCHKCASKVKYIVSLKINKKNTRFAVIGSIELSNVK
jgi:hypothetical protein